jgi:hypothetical protein
MISKQSDHPTTKAISDIESNERPQRAGKRSRNPTYLVVNEDIDFDDGPSNHDNDQTTGLNHGIGDSEEVGSPGDGSDA